MHNQGRDFKKNFKNEFNLKAKSGLSSGVLLHVNVLLNSTSFACAVVAFKNLVAAHAPDTQKDIIENIHRDSDLITQVAGATLKRNSFAFWRKYLTAEKYFDKYMQPLSTDGSVISWVVTGAGLCRI